MWRSRTFLVLTAVSVLLLVSDTLGLLEFVKPGLYSLVTPIKTPLFFVITRIAQVPNIILLYPKLSDIEKENRHVKQTNEEQRLEITQLKRENELLRNQLESPLSPTFTYTPAKISGMTRYMELLVGTDQGVLKGMPVVLGTTLVGVVKQTVSGRTNVMLLTDPDLSVAVKTTRGTWGMTKGWYGKEVTVEKVLQKDPLFIGDTVVTRGGDGIPPNLSIGVISSVAKEDVAVYKEGKMSLTVNPQVETTLFVVTKQ
jgi:cell shape-determining protein MreC